MWEVLTSEFFWGVVIGVLLALLSAIVSTRLLRSETISFQRDTIRSFSLDTVRTIRRYVTEMQNIRNRIDRIELDLIGLVEAELQVFGRNREHIIRLDPEPREEVRAFVNECSIRTVQVRFWLNEALRLHGNNNSTAVNEALDNANRAADQLVAAAQGTDRLIERLGG